jgi:hypothetical protein
MPRYVLRHGGHPQCFPVVLGTGLWLQPESAIATKHGHTEHWLQPEGAVVFRVLLFGLREKVSGLGQAIASTLLNRLLALQRCSPAGLCLVAPAWVWSTRHVAIGEGSRMLEVGSCFSRFACVSEHRGCFFRACIQALALVSCRAIGGCR